MAEATLGTPQRAVLLRRALLLTGITLSWNIVEGVVALAGAVASGSVALLGFGVDSFVESSSAGVMLWRLLAEGRAHDHHHVEQLERRAQRLIALSLFGLAAFVAWEATTSLLRGERPEVSFIGMAITGLSLVVMRWLAVAKGRTAAELGSGAMKADAFQTTACWWLSLITLSGLLLNAVGGWWWADPIAALGMSLFIVKEARETWRGHPCC